MKRLSSNLKRLEFVVPFNSEFNRKIKAAGGTFSRQKKCWSIELEAESIADKILKEVYGYEKDGELVDIIVTIDFKNHRFDYQDDGDAKFLGRVIVHSDSRDYKIIGQGIRVLSGRYFERGGSFNNPVVEFDQKEDFIFQIIDVYKSKVDEFIEKNPDLSNFIQVVSKTSEAKLLKLKERKVELLKELEMIDLQIADLEK